VREGPADGLQHEERDHLLPRLQAGRDHRFPEEKRAKIVHTAWLRSSSYYRPVDGTPSLKSRRDIWTSTAYSTNFSDDISPLQGANEGSASFAPGACQKSPGQDRSRAAAAHRWPCAEAMCGQGRSPGSFPSAAHGPNRATVGPPQKAAIGRCRRSLSSPRVCGTSWE
jgi:hypothetical protein